MAIGVTDSDAHGSRPTWAILSSLGLLGLTIAIAIWAAVSVEASSTIDVDEATGAITIVGPESKFTGQASGIANGREITISGLPLADEIRQDREVWRTFCAFRELSDADWSRGTEMLRAHLMDESMNELCSPFE